MKMSCFWLIQTSWLSTETAAETDRFANKESDIVKRAKNMSSMAFSLYLFTRGEGPLKTTEDLFTQAKYFAEEGSILYQIVLQCFLVYVPHGRYHDELETHVNAIPIYCDKIQSLVGLECFGRMATFNKVDQVIAETRNLMNTVSKVVTACFICATKYQMDSTMVSVTQPPLANGVVPTGSAYPCVAQPPPQFNQLRAERFNPVQS